MRILAFAFLSAAFTFGGVPGQHTPAPPPLANAGAWFFVPGWLEAPAGPWAAPAGALGERGGDTVAAWKVALGQMAENGLDFVITDIGPQNKDRSYGGWSYHYVLKFPKHPEARVFSDEFVDANRTRLRQIFAHARKLGIRPFIHHYNFAAPWSFVKAHPELAHEKHRGTGVRTMDRLRKIAGNLCWSEPLYREFLADCWREFFEAFPEAEGILVTQGECANCKCARCIGEATSTEGFDHYSSPERARMLVDFVSTFRDELTRLGKTPLVRRWGGGEGEAWENSYPKDVTYVFKYSLFDAVNSPIDPEVRRWVAKGYRVWISKEIGGNENAGPVAWTDLAWMERVIRECREAGVAGICSMYNHYFGFTGEWWGPQQLHFRAWMASLAAARAGRPAAGVETKIRRLAEGMYGPRGGEVLAAMTDIGACVLALPTVFGTPNEGLNWKDTAPLRAYGTPPQTPAPFFREGLGTLEEAVAWLSRNALTPAGWKAALPQGKRDPAAVLDEALARARKAEKLFLGFAAGGDPRLADAARLLLPSARIAAGQAAQWRAIFDARVALAASSGPNPADVQLRQLVIARDKFRDALAARGRILEALLDLPFPSVDYMMELWQGDVSSRVPFTQFTARWEEELAALDAAVESRTAPAPRAR